MRSAGAIVRNVCVLISNLTKIAHSPLQVSSSDCRRTHPTCPNSAPMPAVTPMANALQKVTRMMPVRTFAPPT